MKNFLKVLRSFSAPQYGKTFKEGQNRLNSCSQVYRVALGAITKNGPILIEGNELPGYDLYQSKVHMSKNKEGKKPEFDAIIYKKN